jgi:two-component system sensor histidine kinase UhpB
LGAVDRVPQRRGFCHDRVMAAVRVDDARHRLWKRGVRGSSGRRISLFWRLFIAYAGVMALAVCALVFAPVTVSVPTALSEVAVLLVGLAIALVMYLVLLRRALAPLERLTRLMPRIDPLAPGQRVDTDGGDEQVVALARAFNEMLDRLERERRESGLRALAAQEAERRRIARELHDEIGQTLTGLVLRSETITRRAPKELRADVEGLREAARRGAEDVRSIARRLRPEALDELGLQSALLALCGAVAGESGLDVERSLDRDLRLSAEEELVIYRVAQESLTNVVRHADASWAELVLRREADAVVLVVRDDGTGLPPNAERDATGIRGMRERALLIGAALVVRPREPRGTEVRLRLASRERP